MLSDCGHYVHWLFENQDRSNGMNLEVATAHVDYNELATAFSVVTNKPARYIDTPVNEYFSTASVGSSSKVGETFVGDSAKTDPAFMSWRDNFTGFWNLWKYSGENKGVVRRDYALLDEIFPGRIKSAEQWFRKLQDDGVDLWDLVQEVNIKPVLKGAEDAMNMRRRAERAAI